MEYQRKPESTVDAFIFSDSYEIDKHPAWFAKAVMEGKAWLVEKDKEWFLAVLTPYGQALAKTGDYIFLDKDGINVAPKEYFEKNFIPTLDEQKRQIIEACYLQTLESLRKAFSN